MRVASRIIHSLLLMLLVGFPRGFAQSVADLDTKFIFRLQLFSEGEHLGISADIQTSATYPCAGYGIRLSQSSRADTVTIRIGGLIRPNPCFQANDIATSKLFIGPLKQRTYVVRISYRGNADLYRVSVRKNRYTITAVKNEFTEIEKL